MRRIACLEATQEAAFLAGYLLAMPEQTCRQAFDDWDVRQGTILLGVSGGIDSCVLLDVVHRLASARDLKIVVGHVNHQLRGEASEEDAGFVEALARRLGWPVLVRRVSPADSQRNQPSRMRPTLEEAARDLRRAALLEMAEEAKAEWIGLGHHAGDQAETLLLRMLRGTGPSGLGGMAPRSLGGRLLRPLLSCLPEELCDYARARGLDWREDLSNQDRVFSRNRLRADWIPGLREEFNPQLLRTLSNLADIQREESEWIEGIVDEAAAGRLRTDAQGVEFALEGWNELPRALARRLVRRGLVAAGLERDLTRSHIVRVLDFLCRGREAGRDKCVELPRGSRLRRRMGCFRLDSSGAFDNATVQARE